MIKEVALGPSAESKLPDCTESTLCFACYGHPKNGQNTFLGSFSTFFKYLDEITQATVLIIGGVQYPIKYLTNMSSH